MPGRAWLTGIDQHALDVSVCKQAGVACEGLRPSWFQRLYVPGAFTLTTFLKNCFGLRDLLQY
jgi:hypothetical protein